MKAIETIWKGYRFRSRTEARWAVFLEAAGFTFDYEPEGVILPSGPYLPDFRFKVYDQRLNIEGKRVESFQTYWLEVKGHDPTEEEKLRCWELSKASGDEVLLAISSPDTRPQIYAFWGGVSFEEDLQQHRINGGAYFAACDRRGGICFSYIDGRSVVDPEDGTVYPPSTQCWIGHPQRLEEYPETGGSWLPTISPTLQRAYDAARSARFEFGQTDPRWPA